MKSNGKHFLQTADTSKHRPETAALHMTGNVPIALADETIAEVESTILKHSSKYETIHYVYVINQEQQLVGVMSIKELFRSQKSTKVGKVMTKELIYVHPHTDQEHLAMKALRNQVKAIPVIDKDNKLLGVVTPDKIIAILHAEHTEDFLRLSGMEDFSNPAHTIINAPAWILVVKRIPWLLLGLGGGITAAFIVQYFDALLQEQILIAAFIPAIVYLADAVGTQTETIFIRSISIDHKLDVRKYIVREVVVGLSIALILGAVMGLMAWILWQTPTLIYIFGISIFITILTAMSVALMLPFLLSKIKVDPAIATGPFATVIRDIMSLVIYFYISQLILQNLR